ncbi:lytic murein transglycosylase [Mesorhizobium sp. B2-3-13]|nr:lytic murein transglycosylase [Mesorhizobium sp. B2-3-13]
MPSLNAPLWPAGHLPLEEGDRIPSRPSLVFSVAGCATTSKLPISPLEGEMPGRAEGGAS